MTYTGAAERSAAFDRSRHAARGGDLPCGRLGHQSTTAEFPSGLRAPAGCLLDADSPRRAPLDGECSAGRSPASFDHAEHGHSHRTRDPEEYRRRLTLTGQSVRATRGNEILDGVVRGVDSNFGLIVETPDGIRILHSGEVSVRVIAP